MAEVKRLNAQVADLQAQLDAAAAARAEGEEKLRASEAALADLQAQLDAAAAAGAESGEKLRASEAALAELQAQLDAARLPGQRVKKSCGRARRRWPIWKIRSQNGKVNFKPVHPSGLNRLRHAWFQTRLRRPKRHPSRLQPARGTRRLQRRLRRPKRHLETVARPGLGRWRLR